VTCGESHSGECIQTLIVRSARGLVLVGRFVGPNDFLFEVGQTVFPEAPVYLAAGFFGCGGEKGDARDLVENLKRLQVANIATGECSNRAARELLAKAYGDRHMALTAGMTLEIAPDIH